MSSSLVVLCDFDGTVIDIDTSVLVLSKFAKSDWKVFDQQFVRGETTLEECLRRQFSTVRVSQARILKEVEHVPSVRPNLGRLIEFCASESIPLILVSAGLDFVIRRFLEQKGWLKLIRLYAPKARSTPHCVEFAFPRLFDKTSVNFKEDLVRYFKRQGKKVIYVGDGSGDFHAAKHADLSFTIKGSELAQLLRKEGIPHKEIYDFLEVIQALEASSAGHVAHW